MTQKTYNNNLIEDYVIYGAGEAGKQIYSSLPTIKKKVFCFIDDSLQKNKIKLYSEKIISQINFNKLLKKNLRI